MLNQRVGKFTNINKELIIPNYLNFILKAKISREQLKSLGFGSVQFNLSKTDLLNFKIPLPPKNIQEKIVAEIEGLEIKEIEAKEEVEDLKVYIYSILDQYCRLP